MRKPSIDQADYTVWLNNFGMTLPGSGAAERQHGGVPEPSSINSYPGRRTRRLSSSASAGRVAMNRLR